MNDGMFTQPGPDGIFGRGGEPGDPSAPSIDSDGTDLRETMVVAYPSEGHMRVARALRHPDGRVEFQEEYRTPTPDEVEWLKQKNITVGPGSMVSSGQAAGSMGAMPPAVGPAPTLFERAKPVLKWGGILAAVGGGLWAANKWLVPLAAEKLGIGDDGDDDDDDDDDDDGDDD